MTTFAGTVSPAVPGRGVHPRLRILCVRYGVMDDGRGGSRAAYSETGGEQIETSAHPAGFTSHRLDCIIAALRN